MGDFIAIVSEIAPNNAAGLIILAAILFLVWKGGGVSSKFSTFEKKLDGIDGKFVSLESKIDGKRDNVMSEVHKIQGSISAYEKRLEYLESSGFAAAHSPISFTPKGKTLWEDMKMEKIINRSFKKILIEYPRLCEITNPLDVQEYCKEIAENIYDKYATDAEKDKIKIALYKAGGSSSVLHTLVWIRVRDKVIEYCSLDPSALD